MSGTAPALAAAIDLLHLPSRVRLARKSPLPDGVLILLRIVAGDEDAIQEAIAATGRPRETICGAAAFFIEQILLCPEAEPYRVLGAGADASSEELRRHMALLLRWLHPDRDGGGERSVFTARVTLAWDHLKTRERRAAHDQARSKLPAKSSRIRDKSKTRLHSIKHPAGAWVRHGTQHGRSADSGRLLNSRSRPDGFLLRALMFLLGGAKT